MDVMGTTVEEALDEIEDILARGDYHDAPTDIIRAGITALRSKVADLETVVNLQEGLLASYRRERERGKDDGYDEDDRERG
jgi:hypothetical protein